LTTGGASCLVVSATSTVSGRSGESGGAARNSSSVCENPRAIPHNVSNVSTRYMREMPRAASAPCPLNPNGSKNRNTPMRAASGVRHMPSRTAQFRRGAKCSIASLVAASRSTIPATRSRCRRA